MKSISSDEAFLIFGMWRDNASQLQLNMRGARENISSPAWITEISTIDFSVSGWIVADGQKAKCVFDFRDAVFEYGEPLDTAVYPEFAEGKWASYLLVTAPSGSTFFFTERFAEEIAE
jgi:hypothetical protein